jgi:hypothetical protein
MVADLCHSCFRHATPPSKKLRELRSLNGLGVAKTQYGTKQLPYYLKNNVFIFASLCGN